MVDTLAGGPALVMPELELPDIGALNDLSKDNVDLVKKAVHDYAQHYTAEDFKWSHVGFCRKDEQLKAVLFDTKPKGHTPEQKREGRIVVTTEKAMLTQLFPS